ncbi:amidohydrolase family protein [Jiangella rhizosphaerae]|uniref:Amidohydrolase n=1 Tax=Jiangella rhizosphaerae TaxID=2293569 RepID=A0A418KM48_9ACTN|nr:amidohydrolase family protein [Jiangella rhizosphaerae]RIQ19002.1 amidohydrolase [Jiangella rhizosphaerae]
MHDAHPARHRPARIVDAHVHLGHFRNFHIPQNDVDGVVAAMDAMGIDVAVVSAHAAISSDVVYGNDLVLEAMARRPDRIVGYCVVNPNYPDSVTGELERCFEHPGFRGVKVHPELHGDHPLDSRAYRPMWEFAAERGLPVLSHSYFGGDSLDVFGQLAERYPTAQVILGHAGQDFPMDDVVALVENHDNVWLDLCGALSNDGAVDALTGALGSTRILFGSDLPFVNGALQLGTLLYSRLTAEQVADIAYRNAERLFRVARR